MKASPSILKLATLVEFWSTTPCVKKLVTYVALVWVFKLTLCVAVVVTVAAVFHCIINSVYFVIFLGNNVFVFWTILVCVLLKSIVMVSSFLQARFKKCQYQGELKNGKSFRNPFNIKLIRRPYSSLPVKFYSNSVRNFHSKSEAIRNSYADKFPAVVWVVIGFLTASFLLAAPLKAAYFVMALFKAGIKFNMDVLTLVDVIILFLAGQSFKKERERYKKIGFPLIFKFKLSRVAYWWHGFCLHNCTWTIALFIIERSYFVTDCPADSARVATSVIILLFSIFYILRLDLAFIRIGHHLQNKVSRSKYFSIFIKVLFCILILVLTTILVHFMIPPFGDLIRWVDLHPTDEWVIFARKVCKVLYSGWVDELFSRLLNK